jgi:hypothetical protein
MRLGLEQQNWRLTADTGHYTAIIDLAEGENPFNLDSGTENRCGLCL